MAWSLSQSFWPKSTSLQLLPAAPLHGSRRVTTEPAARCCASCVAQPRRKSKRGGAAPRWNTTQQGPPPETAGEWPGCSQPEPSNKGKNQQVYKPAICGTRRPPHRRCTRSHCGPAQSPASPATRWRAARTALPAGLSPSGPALVQGPCTPSSGGQEHLGLEIRCPFRP